MCGRFSLDVDIDTLIDRYRMIKAEDEFTSKDEIFPTDISPVIINREGKELKLLKWGFMPSFAKRPIINARSETIDIKPTFQHSFYNRRCLIPATSFFEWEKVGKDKIKRRVSIKDEYIFSMAGLYDVFTDNNGVKYHAFTILTTEANEEMKSIHHRMPVILPTDKEELWLDINIKNPAVLKQLLKPYEESLSIE